MQYHKRQIKVGMIRHQQAGECRYDNRGMGEDHTEDKTHEDHVQQGIIDGPGVWKPRNYPIDAGQNQPAVAGKQAQGTVSCPLG